MDVHLGQFKYIFLFETLIGTNTVSLTTLKQSKVSVAYSTLSILVFCVEYTLYIYNQLTLENYQHPFIYIIRTIVTGFTVYALFHGVKDYKTKISSSMSLEAIEYKMESLDMKISGKSLFKAMSKVFMILLAISQILMLANNMYGANEVLGFTKYITSIQSAGALLSCLSLLVMYWRKVLIIQRAITKRLSEINQSDVGSSRPASLQREHRSQSRKGNVQTESHKTCMLLSELQGSLFCTEKNIEEFFRIEVLAYFLMIQIISPVTLVSYYFFGQLDPSIFIILSYNMTFFLVICTIENVRQGKEEAYIELCNSSKGSKWIRHQLLANIHRNRKPFSCILYDLEYSIMFDFLENSVLIATACIAYSMN